MSTVHLPLEIYDLITFQVENLHHTRNQSCRDSCRQYQLSGKKTRQRLASLRLVNRAFCHCASRRLFRHIVTRLGFSSRPTPLVQLTEISRSQYAKYVCQIDFGLSGSSKDSVVTAVEDFAAVIQSCLARCTNLKALRFDEPYHFLFQEAAASLYVRGVTAALRYEPLPNLAELDIRFPSAHDFAQFFPLKFSDLQIPITNVVRYLRHLGLHVGEHAGDGTRYWDPISPENICNGYHGKYLFSIVESAINLTSLAITTSGTNMLDLDSVNFSPFLRLRSFYLRKVHISAHNLCSLIDQSRESIRYIKLRMVGLKSGRWKHVLLQMASLPHIVDFGIGCSGYSRLGSNSHLESILVLLQADMQAIATLDPSDHSALGHLQRAVNANRTAIGLPPFSKRKYKFIELPPLNSDDLGHGS